VRAMSNGSKPCFWYAVCPPGAQALPPGKPMPRNSR
jgi:hypothetical protein